MGGRGLRSVLLLSGGLDSSAVAFLKRPDGALVVDYGQRPAEGEIRAATAIAGRLRIPLGVLKIDASSIGSGLLNKSDPLSVSPSAEWWPYRNQLLVTIAAAWALARGYREVVVGSVSSDAFHVDGTPAFYSELGKLIEMQEGHVHLAVPAIKMKSAELLLKSGIPSDVLPLTLSCHRGAFACGDCSGCRKHESTLLEAGLK